MVMKVQFVQAEETYPLRRSVLRAGMESVLSVYPLDTSPKSFHLAVKRQSRIVGVASFHFESHERLKESHSFRLRGMAVDPEFQRSGVGSALLERGIREASVREVTAIWCNARESAVAFYLRHGFHRVGERFEIDGIGPHYFMALSLDSK